MTVLLGAEEKLDTPEKEEVLFEDSVNPEPEFEIQSQEESQVDAEQNKVEETTENVDVKDENTELNDSEKENSDETVSNIEENTSDATSTDAQN